MTEFFDPLAILFVVLRHPARVSAAVAALALTSGGVAVARTHASDSGASITVALPPAVPASLYAEASSLDIQSSGQEAEMYNATLPFVDTRPTPAKPFILTGNDSDRAQALHCMTQAVYYEANGEPVKGQRAVAQVVLNRVRHPAFPKSVCGVVYEGAGSGKCQFSFVCNGSLDRRPEPGAWRTAEMVAREALYGYVEPSVGEATHYHADYVVPVWATALAKVASIGQHIFYRWPGAWGAPSAFTGRYVGEGHATGTSHPAMAAANGEGSDTKVAAQSARLSYGIAALLDTAPSAAATPARDEAAAAAPVPATGGNAAIN